MKPEDWNAVVFLVLGFLLVALMLWATGHMAIDRPTTTTTLKDLVPDGFIAGT